ncbi:2Fe-2S iron-sulfur cluster-binding protein [Caulobacter sp. SSI4214]|uniref:2Fe-2S iron-sulfur cluster-binding protein n=1 Tax=Caulobacter sp. SSI4214 TaxID=2575739 RepID=UPI00143A48DB|nr:2Fe-2S iron-sulfur cluster-binding protein [Caulobacter sp. SSI4214]
MPTFNVLTREGQALLVAGDEGLSLMEVLKGGGVDEILALCGGSRSCATCHVYVDDAFLQRLSPMSSDEDDLLDSSDHRRSNSRLSCQIQVSDALDGMLVTVAPED